VKLVRTPPFFSRWSRAADNMIGVARPAGVPALPR
jgi:hypothetical protein